MTYASEVAADNPRIWWKLDETSGTTANDSSVGGTLDGTFAGSYTLNALTCPNGDAAARITGTTVADKVSVSYASYTPAAITIEAWVRPYALVDYSFYVNDWDTQGMMYATALGGFGGGEWYDRRGAGANNPIKGWITAQTGFLRDLLRVGEWTHLVYVNTGTYTELYRNGKKISGVYFNAPVIKASTVFDVKWGDIGLAHVAQYDTALSEARIKAHYDAMVTPPGPTDLEFVGAIAAEAYGGDMTWALPHGTQAGDIVVAHICQNDDAGDYLSLTNDGLTEGTVYASSRFWSAYHGTVTSGMISQGGLKPKVRTGNTTPPTSKYAGYTLAVYRNATVVSGATANNNTVTANALGQRVVSVLTGLASDDTSDGWNKTGASSMDLKAALPTGQYAAAVLWEGPLANGDSFTSFPTMDWNGSSVPYASAAAFLIGPSTPVPPPPGTRPSSRIKRPVNRGSLSRAVY